jgi:hypothetical protein
MALLEAEAWRCRLDTGIQLALTCTFRPPSCTNHLARKTPESCGFFRAVLHSRPVMVYGVHMSQTETDTPITARLPIGDAAKLEKLAALSDRTRSAEIRRAVREYLDRELEAA